MTANIVSRNGKQDEEAI